MNKIDRVPVFQYGARFYRDGDKDMFEHRIDSRATIGPRVATKTDKQNHSALWEAYAAEQMSMDFSEKTAKRRVK